MIDSFVEPVRIAATSRALPFLLQLGLRDRVVVALQNAGVHTLADLNSRVARGPLWSDNVRGLSRRSSLQVEEALFALGVASPWACELANASNAACNAACETESEDLPGRRSATQRRDAALIEARKLVRRWRIGIGELRGVEYLPLSNWARERLAAWRLCTELVETWAILHAELEE